MMTGFELVVLWIWVDVPQVLTPDETQKKYTCGRRVNVMFIYTTDASQSGSSFSFSEREFLIQVSSRFHHSGRSN
jgi:hypothetical protein